MNRISIDRKNDITSSKSPLRLELMEELFVKLKEVLNEVHGTDFSVRFWKLVIRDYVNAVVSRKKLLEMESNNRLPDLYPINGYKFPTRKEKIKKRLILNLKHLVTRFNYSRLKKGLINHDQFHIGFPDIESIRDGELGTRLPEYYPFYIGRGNKEKRDYLNEIAHKTEDHYLKNVFKEIPKVFIEHFDEVYDDIVLIRPEKKVFHTHINPSLYIRIMIAKYLEQGAKLNIYQHGAEYGEFSYDVAHTLELSVSDEFRTWGWKIHANDVPWKAYRLEDFKNKYESRILNPEYELLLCFPALNSGSAQKKYKALIESILNGLDSSKYNSVLARPRRNHKLYCHKSKLNFINHERVSKSTGLANIAEDMSKCDAVLQLKVPCTNFLECIYVNHPTMGLLRNDRPTEIVKPVYDFFLVNGVLHRDVKSLLFHLNNINLNSWWQDVINDERYIEFKNTFTSHIK